jgi:chromosome segregation ATPase
VTVYGQKLIPNRIVFEGDSGVFYTRKQELILLKELSKVKKLETELDSVKEEKKECEKQLKLSDIDNNKMSQEYFSLKNKVEDKGIEKNDLENQLESQKKKTKLWKKTSLGVGVAAAGTVMFAATGLWLPALTVVAVTEIAIIFTNREK